MCLSLVTWVDQLGLTQGRVPTLSNLLGLTQVGTPEDILGLNQVGTKNVPIWFNPFWNLTREKGTRNDFCQLV